MTPAEQRAVFVATMERAGEDAEAALMASLPYAAWLDRVRMLYPAAETFVVPERYIVRESGE